VIFIECKNDVVILHPTQRPFSLESLSHSPAYNPLYQAVKKQIELRQAMVRPGEPPLRIQVRFLVQPDAVRTFHMAYPALDRLAVEKRRQNLQPEDDVAVITRGP
jgi:hypothetical protein